MMMESLSLGYFRICCFLVVLRILKPGVAIEVIEQVL